MLLIAIICLLGWATGTGPEINFAPVHGYYDKPFLLNLSLPSKLSDPKWNYAIRYVVVTSPASERLVPTRTSGTVWDGKPISISRTTVVHAVGYNSSDITDITSSTYIFLADVLTQPDMYKPNIDAVGAANVLLGLKAIPAIHISSASSYPTECNGCGDENCNVFSCWGPCRADNPRVGRAEYLDFKNPDKNWHEQVWWDIYGGASRMYQKKNIRLHFNNTLDFKLFKGFDWGVGSARTFKSIDLRGHSQDGAFGQRWGGRMLWARNIFQDWTLQDDVVIVPHAKQVHVYFNTAYQGMSHVRERLSSNFFTAYLGATKDDYEAVNSGRLTDGPLYDASTYKKIIATPTYKNLNQYFDWNNFLTYAIMQHYTGNADLGGHNWQLGGQHKLKPWGGKHGGWKFFPSDGDLSFYVLAGPTFDSTSIQFLGNTFLTLMAEAHVDFMILFHDYTWEHLQKNGGTLTPAAVQDRFQRIFDLNFMNYTMMAELARWGYVPGTYWCKMNSVWTYQQWVDAYPAVRDAFFPVRSSNVLSQYAARGWLNSVGGFDFSLKDMVVYPAGTNLDVTARNAGTTGDFYYTLSGADPRVAGGGVLAGALKVALVNGKATIKLSGEPVLVTGRIRSAAGVWGPIDRVTAVTGSKQCKLCGNIIITEVSYHPEKKSNLSNFVEVKNIGKVPLNMAGVTITGINVYKFPPITLQPGQFFVIGFFWEDFNAIYGKYPDDVHIAQISQDNKGDELVLTDAYGNIVHDMDFDTVKPWTEIPDGLGWTLVARPENYKDIAANSAVNLREQVYWWRTSASKLGSPWQDDPTEPEWLRNPPIQFSYISFEKDWVELSNPTKKDIDISGWCLQDKMFFKSGTHEYFIPAGTILRANSKLKITKTGLGFNRKDNPVLFVFNQTMNVFTGQFVEFVVSDAELAFK